MEIQRINVVGTSGAGKTTLARQLAHRLGIPHVELDALYWGPNWTPTPDDEFRRRVAQALSGEAWTVDGNYSAVRSLIWARAEAVVWLDYALPVVMGRVIWRTVRRAVRREEMWHGNRERFRETFLSRESIIWWAWSTYHRRKRQYPELFRQPEYAHLTVIRLPSPRAAQQWLAAIPRAAILDNDHPPAGWMVDSDEHAQ